MATNRRPRGRGTANIPSAVRRSRRRSQSQEPFNYRRYLITTLVLVTAVILGYFVYIYDFTSQEDPTSKDERTISQILKLGVTATEELLAHEYQMDAFFMDENVAQLIKRRLSPVQDRVSSLRTQTSQYEEMEHISGGPSHFISTTLEELDKLEEITTELNVEVQHLTNQLTQRGRALSDDVSKVIDQNLIVIEPNTLEILGENGIFLMPMEYSEEPGCDITLCMQVINMIGAWEFFS